MEEEKRLDQLTALLNIIFSENMLGYRLRPKLGKSRNFKFRDATMDDRLFEACWDEYGRVFPAEDAPTTLKIRLESHLSCRCRVKWMLSILAGTATVNGNSGADYVVKQTGDLPENYISKMEAVKKDGNLG